MTPALGVGEDVEPDELVGPAPLLGAELVESLGDHLRVLLQEDIAVAL
jgi:hypothetical protein